MIAAAVERCAGIDVGKKILSVCVLTGPLNEEPQRQLRRYGVTMDELEQLKQWLVEQAVTHVVMESTGSYWKPIYNVPESTLVVYLANPQEVKNRKGHKTDDKDGWWLAHLLRHAMIHPSFIPPLAIRQLRDLTRRRKKMLGTATAEKNRIQKVLEDANVKLGNGLTDIFGVSGQLVLEALIADKASPEQVTELIKGSAKKKMPEIIQSLKGHKMSDHHRRMITYSLQHLEYLESHILELDQEIATMIKQAGLLPQLELLQTIPGLQERSAATILAETGGDMKSFPSASHLSSWGGVCPGNNRSAGKSKSSRTTKGNPFLRSALTECAWAAAATKNSFLRDKFWRVTSRSGGKKPPAVVAVAHTLLLLIYHVLNTGEPFTDKTAPATNDKQRERLIRHHVRKLGKLGISISRSVLTKPGEKPTHRRRKTDSD